MRRSASEVETLVRSGADGPFDRTDEREAIVISFLRSNDRGDVGFLGRSPDGPRRLNVALTRAERFLDLAGDWETLRSGAENGNECADLYRELADYADERGGSVGEGAGSAD